MGLGRAPPELWDVPKLLEAFTKPITLKSCSKDWIGIRFQECVPEAASSFYRGSMAANVHDLSINIECNLCDHQYNSCGRSIRADQAHVQGSQAEKRDYRDSEQQT